MPKIKIKPIVTYRLRGRKETATRTLLATRDLIDVSDEPLDRDGTNEGFAPTEFVLGGLAACTNVISHKIAAAHGIEIIDLDIGLVAKFNRMGVNLEEDVELPFPEIRMTVEVTTTASIDQVRIIESELHKYCAVAKLIRKSGTNIIEEWRVKPPADRPA